jgi:hypothetical protein
MPYEQRGYDYESDTTNGEAHVLRSWRQCDPASGGMHVGAGLRGRVILRNGVAEPVDINVTHRAGKTEVFAAKGELNPVTG